MMDEPEHHQRVKSTLAGNIWPAIPSTEGSQMLSLLYQMEQSQWFDPATLEKQQLQQAKILLQHAYSSCDHYRTILDEQAINPDDINSMQAWRTLPILKRTTVQESKDRLLSNSTPKSHGRISSGNTSGSTGQPLTYHKTELSQLIWKAHTVRDHLWHRRDFSKKIAYIRDMQKQRSRFSEGVLIPGWGPVTNAIYETGPSAIMDSSTPIEQQCRWLIETDPTYLLSYASNLEAIANWFKLNNHTLPSLQEALSFGELLKPDTRSLYRDLFEASVSSTYSSNEIGYLALQCHEKGSYHVQTESVLLEIVDSEGEPCLPGEVGRVIVTPLHNFAMPLIRYEIGDYAELATPCSCKRGSPTISQVMGRERNMLRLPDGSSQWPSLNSEFRGVLLSLITTPRFQVVQTELRKLELRIETSQSLPPSGEERIREALNKSIGEQYAYSIKLHYLNSGELSNNHKLEDFRSELIQSDREQTV
ncbi:hypothetical protein BOW53_08535 [Solemya pervernicosa gill symbiont]|uniref:AMP-dependent synthetase/ligase domain-containing protein n=2 Tax=Gammaproteobacteria incertae sedis TaxID=118884 RepID=A0A1T2L519_9GAMM|nr:phenylacetate--CoA ligase family protein [Candidatus Reidiella endopervernicosa]OOZ40207.1 hypothetical protein BOW53_08535 [Solemya pervernicosa gill symbiont]QKQ27137.1 phenylacetate--CoA ligase family protein [Candidatus Reidiella endopervernicosa]